MALGADVAALVVSLRLDDKGFTGKLNAAAGSLKSMDQGMAQIGRGSGQVAQGVGKIADRVILAGAGLAAFAVTTASSFETAFTGVEKTVDATEQEFAELEATIREMARTGLGSFEELASIGETGGALGIARESLDEFIDVVSRIGMSTDLTVDQASTALGQLGNILKLEGEGYEEFADILVALGNDGASTEGQIIDLAARFGAAGNAAGLTNEQILTLASTTASMGVEAEAGGGALSRIFNNLTLDMATASDEGELLAETLGMSLDELKRSWDQDAGGVFEDLLAHISKLDQFEAAAFLSDLGITNTRDINAIRLLSQGIEEYRDQLETATDANGALREESDKFLATSERQWFKLQQNVRDAAATLGAELLPVVNEVVGELTAWLQEPGTQRGLKEFAENLASGLKGLIDDLRTADFGPLIETMKGAVDIAKVGIDLFNALPGPVKQLALATIIGNKLTGGALTDIAKGFGNIFSGVLKIAFQRGATPANPLFVAPVGGGLGGVGGAGGAAIGGSGALATVLKAAGVLAIAQIAKEFAPHIARIGQDLHEEWGLPDPPAWLTGFLDLGVNDIPFLNSLLNEQPTKTFQPGPLGKSPAGTGTPGGTGTADWAAGLNDVEQAVKTGTSEWAAGLNDLKTEVATLPDTSMMAPAVGALTQNLPSIRSKADQQLAAQAQALAAVRATTSEVGRLAGTPHNVNVDTHVTVNTSVGVSVLQQQAYRSRTVYNRDSVSTNTAGF
jgi:TP901 family phage tail tape measure protein